MNITAYKEDYRDSGWFELLKELEIVPSDWEFDHCLDTKGEIADRVLPNGNYLADYFVSSAYIEIEVKSFEAII